jgi:hypothetical protein
MRCRACCHAHRGERVALELPAGGGELRAVARAHEQTAVELFLERADAGAHRRLRDVQARRRAVEVAGLRDLEKGPQVLDVHRSASTIDILDQEGQ